VFVDGGRGACATAQWHNGQSKPGKARSTRVTRTSLILQYYRHSQTGKKVIMPQYHVCAGMHMTSINFGEH